MICNQCCYSSIGRFNGVVKLHCGLVGRALDEMPSECSLGRRPDTASERHIFWQDRGLGDDVACPLLVNRPLPA